MEWFMKKLMLAIAATFSVLATAAPAADAQVGPGYVGPGYYGPGYAYGGPYYRPDVYVGSPRYFYGPPVYGPGYVRINPFYRPYANSCFRWQLIPTSIGPEWRMVNTCPTPAFVGPVYRAY
jgi:hypothetical protein